ncbi:hypothetical protein VP01_2433g2 [Puccinia sorghi]|uniref:Uncharacterized protein n=1 Tax=Puccinia sorghi TaxID=27349 RepID=A0A0L6V873_9BASI|nr:hypothetical protein VP01_2433g2 [Puccinia sorghi]
MIMMSSKFKNTIFSEKCITLGEIKMKEGGAIQVGIVIGKQLNELWMGGGNVVELWEPIKCGFNVLSTFFESVDFLKPGFQKSTLFETCFFLLNHLLGPINEEINFLIIDCFLIRECEKEKKKLSSADWLKKNWAWSGAIPLIAKNNYLLKRYWYFSARSNVCQRLSESFYKFTINFNIPLTIQYIMIPWGHRINLSTPNETLCILNHPHKVINLLNCFPTSYHPYYKSQVYPSVFIISSQGICTSTCFVLKGFISSLYSQCSICFFKSMNFTHFGHSFSTVILLGVSKNQLNEKQQNKFIILKFSTIIKMTYIVVDLSSIPTHYIAKLWTFGTLFIFLTFIEKNNIQTFLVQGFITWNDQFLGIQCASKPLKTL